MYPTNYALGRNGQPMPLIDKQKEQKEILAWLQTPTGMQGVSSIRKVLQIRPWLLTELGTQPFWVAYKSYLWTTLHRQKNYGELKRLLLMIPGVDVKSGLCGLAGKDVYYWQQAANAVQAKFGTSNVGSTMLATEAMQWLVSDKGKTAVESLIKALESGPLSLPEVGGLPFWIQYKEHLSNDVGRARRNGEMKEVLALVSAVAIRGDLCGLSDAGAEYWEQNKDAAREVFDSDDLYNFIGIVHIKPSADLLGAAFVTLTNCRNRIGTEIADQTVFIQERDSVGFADLHLAIGRKTPQSPAPFLYQGKQAPIQVVRWSETLEGQKGGAALDFFVSKSGHGRINVANDSLLSNVIVEDGQFAFAGFMYDPDSKELRFDGLRMTSEWNSVLHEMAGICWSQCFDEGRVRVLIPKSADNPTDEILSGEYFDREINDAAGFRSNGAATIGELVDFTGMIESDSGLRNEPPEEASDVDVPLMKTGLDPMVEQSYPEQNIPEKIQGLTKMQWDYPDEIDFLNEFVRYVERCNFKYEKRDLVRFHTCVKNGMLTVLGGDPGLGKSSLVRLYARALAGSSAQRDNFCVVDVSPAWTEPEDLMGYRNIEGEFVPAANGLYKFLASHEKATEDLVICLEEMNLARVEYYFNQVLQVMERASDSRSLKIADGIELSVPQGVRFIGTINFDETVQELSPRIYDRCNYIELKNVEMDVFSTAEAELKLFDGKDRDVKRLTQWTTIKGRTIDGHLREVFNRVWKLLEPLHLQPSPRVAKAIVQYVLTRPPLDGETDSALQLKALDEAIVQRVLPKSRRMDPHQEKAQMSLYGELEASGLLLSRDYYGKIIEWE